MLRSFGPLPHSAGLRNAGDHRDSARTQQLDEAGDDVVRWQGSAKSSGVKHRGSSDFY